MTDQDVIAGDINLTAEEVDILRRSNYMRFVGCTECGGAGVMPVPKTDMGCPCCQGREKERPCKKCNARGYQLLQEDDGEI